MEAIVSILRRMNGIAWLAAACLTLAAAGAASAEDMPITQSEQPRLIRRDLPDIQPGRELRAGIFRLHPSLQGGVEYDDNVRLSDTNEQEDVIFTEVPGLQVDVRPGDHRLTAGYWAEMLQFVDISEENAVNHIANGNAELDFGHLQIDVRDLMQDATSRLQREDSSRTETLLNTASVLARLQSGKLVGEAGYRNNLVDYKSPLNDPDDYTEHIFTGLVGVKVAPKTALFIEPSVGEVNYDSNLGNADHDYWQVMGGIGHREYFRDYDEATGEVERAQHTKVQWALRAGFQDRELSGVAGRGPQDDFSGFVADSFIVYRPTITESLFIGYTAAPRVSTFQTNEWYREDRFNVALKKRVTRKLYVIPRFSWLHNDYPEPATLGGVTAEREDDILQFQPELRYEGRVNEVTGEAWFWVSLFYTLRSRDSNMAGVDFDNNKVGVRVGFTY